MHMRTGHRVTAYQVEREVADNNVDVGAGSGHGNEGRSKEGEHRAGHHLQFSMSKVVTARQPFLLIVLSWSWPTAPLHCCA